MFKNKTLLIGLALFLYACDSSEYPTVGGKVDGLDGELVLQNNKSQELIIEKDGSFAFPNLFYSPYSVVIVDKPVDQTCFITNDSGDVTNQDITDVNVNCYPDIVTFTPLTATTVSVDSVSTATIQYLITNESKRALHLNMSRITAVTQLSGVGICPKAGIMLGINQSCVLSLSVHGNQLNGSISGGPELCQRGESLCFEPSQTDRLNITQ